MTRIGLRFVLFFFAAGLLVACSSNAREVRELKDELAERDRRIAALETQRNEFENKKREFEQSLLARQNESSAQKKLPALEAPCDERLAQLRATLNKAYLDMKIAIVERDEFKKKLDLLSKNKMRSPP